MVPGAREPPRTAFRYAHVHVACQSADRPGPTQTWDFEGLRSIPLLHDGLARPLW